MKASARSALPLLEHGVHPLMQEMDGLQQSLPSGKSLVRMTARFMCVSMADGVCVGM